MITEKKLNNYSSELEILFFDSIETKYADNEIIFFTYIKIRSNPEKILRKIILKIDIFRKRLYVKTKKFLAIKIIKLS